MAQKPGRRDKDYPKIGAYRGTGSADLPKAPTSVGASHNRSGPKSQTPQKSACVDTGGRSR